MRNYGRTDLRIEGITEGRIRTHLVLYRKRKGALLQQHSLSTKLDN
jgi:hypothetical protein